MFGIRKASRKLDLLGGAFALFAVAMLWTSPTWANLPDVSADEVDVISIVDSIEMEVDCI